MKEEPPAYVPKPVGLRPATGNSAAPQVSSTDSAAKSMVQSEIKEQRTMPEESPKQMELFEDVLLSPKARLRHRIIGQLFDTYWLVEYDDKFYIIDQHAAHEKVLYEKLLKEYAK